MSTNWRCIALLLVTSLGMSQSSAIPQNSSETPKIKTSTDLVMVPVVVRKSGMHVGDLKKENFTLLVDKKPQEIAYFEEVHTVAANLDAPREGEEFSNVRRGQNVERLTIIAVDLVNTAPLDQLYLKQEIVKFLDGATQTAESYCLLAFTKGGIQILQGFTTDRKQIINAALKQDSQPNGREPVGSTGVAVFDETPCAASAGNCGWHEANKEGLKELELWKTLYKTQESLDVFRDWNARFDTLSTLQQIAQWLSGVPGRKTLVWAGSGVQLYGGMIRVAAQGNGPQRDYSTLNFGSVAQAVDENSYTFNLLNAANVAVYPLDARHGANTSFEVFDVSRPNAPIGQGAFAGQKGRVQNQDQEIIAMFQQIAANTGGKPCFNRTDLANCLKEFAADSRDYYMIGFYADRKLKPGWHALNVKLDRNADLRHRKVFAFTGSGVGLLAASDLELALSSPLPYTEVQINGRFTGVDGPAGKRLVHFELNLPPKTIGLGEQGNALKLDVRAVVRSAGGKEVTNLSQRVDRKLETQQAARIHDEGIHYTNRFELPPGSYGVWFAVHDSNTGHTGSVATTFTVQ